MKLTIRNRWFVTAILTSLIGFSVYIFQRPILTFVGSLPVVKDDLKPVDLIAVISGTLPEIHYGINLYHSGQGERLLFIGHFPVELAVLSENPFEMVEKPWDEIARHLAIKSGIPAEAILYSDAFSASTFERVTHLIETARTHDQRSMIIVCDPIHSRRVAFSVRRIIGDEPMSFLMAPTPADYYPEAYRYQPDGWWIHENHLKEVPGEYVKLVYYWFKYGPLSQIASR